MNQASTREEALNFAVVGVGGYIAPRHLEAIRQTGNRLVAAADPSDSVGLLDRYGFEISYFKEIERFDRFLYRGYRGQQGPRVDYVSICSPNYLHDAHIRMALRNGCDAICEKPLVVNPWNLDALAQLERETGQSIFTVLQLRVHPQLMAIKERLAAEQRSERHDVKLVYVTSRGRWYDYSWKGQEQYSGGIAVNIGVHFFDLLAWLFGDVQEVHVYLKEARRMAGTIDLARARVRWFLSVNPQDLPAASAASCSSTYRCLTIDGGEVEFSDGFADLHTEVYRRTLSGDGYRLTDARAAIELTHRIRTVPVESDQEVLTDLLPSSGPHGEEPTS